MQTGDDFSSDIRVDEGFRKFKMFSKDIQFSVTADEADKGDRSVRNVIELGEGEFSGKPGRCEACFLDEP
jgi:hypothetical protein